MTLTGSLTSRRKSAADAEPLSKRCATPGAKSGATTHRGRSCSNRMPMTPKPRPPSAHGNATRTPTAGAPKNRNPSVAATRHVDPVLTNEQGKGASRCASTTRLPQKLRTRSQRFTGTRPRVVSQTAPKVPSPQQASPRRTSTVRKPVLRSKSGRLSSRRTSVVQADSPPKAAKVKNVGPSAGPSPVQPPTLPAGGDSSQRLSLTTVPPSNPATPETGSLCSARSSSEKQLIGGRLDGLIVTDVVLGMGAFGEVCVGVLNGIEVAVKQIPRPPEDPFGNAGPSAEEFRTECGREAELLAELKHLHVLPLVGATVADDEAVIVTEKCNPITLEDMIDPTHPGHVNPEGIMLREALVWLRDVADGLTYVHKKSIVHRDVKPSNVLFSEEKQQVRIVDFGFAARTGVEAKASGTPNYVAPEIWQRNAHHVAQDVFSFGVMALEVLMWTMLPELGSVIPTYERAKRLVRLPESLPLPDDVRDVLVDCLQKKPENRPSIDEIAVRLSDACDECDAAATLAPPPGVDYMSILMKLA